MYRKNSKNLNRVYGGHFIDQFFKEYEIAFKKTGCEATAEEIEADAYKFCELLNDFANKYVDKKTYKSMQTRLNELEKERENAYYDYSQFELKKEKDRIAGNYEMYKHQLELNFENKEIELKNQIKELEAKLEKWKAMYTGQAEANAILVRKLEKEA